MSLGAKKGLFSKGMYTLPSIAIKPYAFLPLLALISNLVLGVFIFHRNSREKLSRLYILVTFALAAWSLCDAAFVAAPNSASAELWNRFSSVGSLLRQSRRY